MWGVERRELFTSSSRVAFYAGYKLAPVVGEGANIARIGKREHQRILGHAARRFGIAFPGMEGEEIWDIVPGFNLHRESRNRVIMGDNPRVGVAAVVDGYVFDQGVVGEIKLGSKGTWEQMLQLMINCLVVSKHLGGAQVQGFLYMANSGYFYWLENGGNHLWDYCVRLCQLTALIYTTDEERRRQEGKTREYNRDQRRLKGIKRGVRRLPPEEIEAFDQYLFNLGREIDSICWGEIKPDVEQILKNPGVSRQGREADTRQERLL